MRLLKLGGTSLAGPERLRAAARIVEESGARDSLAVVVSAQAGVTDALSRAIDAATAGQVRAADRLIRFLEAQHLPEHETLLSTAEVRRFRGDLRRQLSLLARQLEGITLLGICPGRVRDRILAAGERLSASLFAGVLRRRGLEAEIVDGGELITIDSAPGEAAVDRRRTRQRIRKRFADWPANRVAVVTGFIGRDRDGHTRTLGRGASDYTATLVGAALEVAAVEIWSDVDGLMSADPNKVPDAVLLPRLTYDEAAELAGFGAKVLHPETLAPVASCGIPVVLRNSLRPQAPGTRIEAPRTADGGSGMRAVSVTQGVTRLRLDGESAGGLASRALAAVERQGGRCLQMSWEAPGRGLSLWVLAEGSPRPGLAREVGRGVRLESRTGCAMVAATAADFPPAQLAADSLRALAHAQVELLGLTLPGSAQRSVVALVDQDDLDTARLRLHEVLLGPDLLGRGTDQQVAASIPALLAGR